MKRLILIIISCFVLQFSAAQYDGYSSSSWENQLKIEDLFLKHIDKTSFKKRATEDLLRKYKNTILKINELHPNVHFFLYNTGGYPFRHPFWYYDDVVTNLDKRVKEFFKYKIDLHIESIKPCLWSSTAMTIEKDVLSFLETINYFDDLINC